MKGIKEFCASLVNDIKNGRNLTSIVFIIIALAFVLLRASTIFWKLDWLGNKETLREIYSNSILYAVTLLLIAFINQNNKLTETEKKTTQLISKVEDLLYNRCTINIMDTWMNGFEKILPHTRYKLVMIQTYFPDASSICDAILGYLDDHPTLKLAVDIYIIDPESTHGTQRTKELLFSENIVKSDEELLKTYSTNYNHSVETFNNKLRSRSNIMLRLWKYSSLPTLKLYKFDDTEYMFGWFGTGERSTRNVPMHISKNNADTSILRLTEKINNHLKAVADHSIEII